MLIPVWKAMPWQGDAIEKLEGSCPAARKIFFSLEISFEVYLYDRLALKFVRYISVTSIMY